MINKPLLSGVSLLTCLALTSCSYSTTFVLLNTSSQVLHVTAALDPSRYNIEWCILEPGKWFLGPAVIDESEITTWWDHLDARSIRYDPHACSIDVQLPPTKALVLWRVSGYRPDAPAHGFPTSLVVTGPSGTLTYNGMQLHSLFTLESRQLATLRVR